MNQQAHLKSESNKRLIAVDYISCPEHIIAMEWRSTLMPRTIGRHAITLDPREFREVKWLFKQYDLAKPGWVRRTFVTNRRRTKCLIDVLDESGLGRSWCPHVAHDNSWSTCLHSVWHRLEGSKR